MVHIFKWVIPGNRMIKKPTQDQSTGKWSRPDFHPECLTSEPMLSALQDAVSQRPHHTRVNYLLVVMIKFQLPFIA